MKWIYCFNFFNIAFPRCIYFCFQKQVDILQEHHLENADLNNFRTFPYQVSNQNISRGRNVSEIELIKDIQELEKVSSLSHWL